ncbi:hypothetical protein NE237_018164 [Protea cynaroides]|uniref:RING-type domain-containing protein n=1 Tax=Protea cynaroides TaxID=273540 RepID=A0A9Q0QNQ7_9MAGN|nr:hypothetical protein NE237_018164 [Protea cynaroides]
MSEQNVQSDRSEAVDNWRCLSPDSSVHIPWLLPMRSSVTWIQEYPSIVLTAVGSSVERGKVAENAWRSENSSKLSNNKAMTMKRLLAFFIHLLSPTRRRPKQLLNAVKIIESGVSEMIVDAALATDTRDEGEYYCCVCLVRLGEGNESESESESETCKLPCSHMFHKGCVDRWFSLGSKTCPICRYVLKEGKASLKREELTDEMLIWFSSFHVAGF